MEKVLRTAVDTALRNLHHSQLVFNYATGRYVDVAVIEMKAAEIRYEVALQEYKEWFHAHQVTSP